MLLASRCARSGDYDHPVRSATCKAGIRVILTTPDEIETWLTAPREQARQVQRPLPDAMLKVVAKVDKNGGD